jgi:hypothetical protein
VLTEVNRYIKDANYRVMEVYKLGMDMGVQLNYGRAFNL